MFKCMMKRRYTPDSPEEPRGATRDRSPSESGDVVKSEKGQELGDKVSRQDFTTKNGASPDFAPPFALVQVFRRNSHAGDDKPK